MDCNSLTPKDLLAFRFIRNAVVHEGRPPSVREVQSELGYKSPRAAAYILEKLMEKGYIARVGRQRLAVLRDTPDLEDQAQTVKVPLVGTAPCGAPLLAEENVQALIPVSTRLARPPHRHFLLCAKGDSMDRAGINDGDVVLVRQQPTAQNGDRVVALIDDEATIKEFRRAGNTIKLEPSSSNPLHTPIILASDFQVQGVVVGTIPDWRRGKTMSKRPVIVGPSGDGRWTVKEGGASKPTSTHHKQSTAIEKAEKIAKEQQTELIIRGRDGTIRSKDSFGPDPNPPKDKEH
jgi:repressor LexA